MLRTYIVKGVAALGMAVGLAAGATTSATAAPFPDWYRVTVDTPIYSSPGGSVNGTAHQGDCFVSNWSVPGYLHGGDQNNGISGYILTQNAVEVFPYC